MQLSKFSFSSDLLCFIGQKYLKDILCIKKLFYKYKDDELQKILFGEVLYKHNQFPKTTMPLKFFFPKVNNNIWIFNSMFDFIMGSDDISLIVDNFDEHNEIMDELNNRQSNDEYQIYLTFEKEKTLVYKLEYIIYNGYDNEPVIYSDEFISYTIDNEKLKQYIPNVYKKIVKKLNKRFFD